MVTQTVTRTVPGAGASPKLAPAELPALAPAEPAAKKERLYMGYFLTPVVWKNALGFLVLHLIAVYGLYVLCARGKVLSWFYVWLSGLLCGFGVTVGAHRLFTHRCFRASWGVRFALVVLHTIAGQNCMYVWVRDHRQHHRYSDTHADPHNVQRGFFFSHIGWLMMRKHPAVFEKGKNIDLSDLERDPIVMFQKRYYKTLYVLFAIMLPTMIPILAWDERPDVALFGCYFFRMIMVLNITWLVNSAAHMFGTRPFNKNIEAVECKMVAFLSLGEGWHNYHHCFPWDYRAAELGSKHDLSTKVIDFMARRGWVTDLKFASESLVRKRAMEMGDGTHAKYGDPATTHEPHQPYQHHHFMPEETPISAASTKWVKHEEDAAAAAAAREFVQTLPTAKGAAAMSLS
ncbi:hypothetical protein R5R35_010082 [Gryllus longicercus]|uniref:Fatty acid desaturase domain-containing protein n=1 Tax=Gryllus longicercus TaxID=2509291 RepID=A0AAN9VKF8_9ORTH